MPFSTNHPLQNVLPEQKQISVKFVSFFLIAPSVSPTKMQGKMLHLGNGFLKGFLTVYFLSKKYFTSFKSKLSEFKQCQFLFIFFFLRNTDFQCSKKNRRKTIDFHGFFFLTFQGIFGFHPVNYIFRGLIQKLKIWLIRPYVCMIDCGQLTLLPY